MRHVIVTTVLPSGQSFGPDWRPGHSISGLLYYLDPFQRYYATRLARVSLRIPR